MDTALTFYDNLRAQGMSPLAARIITFERHGIFVPVEPVCFGFGSDFCKTIVGSSTGPQYGP